VEALPAPGGAEGRGHLHDVQGAQQGGGDSRVTIFYEKFVKEVLIEAETMVSIVRTQIMPAALLQQTTLAEAVPPRMRRARTARTAARSLREFVGLVNDLRAATDGVEAALRRTLEGRRGARQAHQGEVRRRWRSAAAADQLEGLVPASCGAADVPELLFIK